MNLLRKAKRRRVHEKPRATTRLVERLEARDLLALVVGNIAPVAGQGFTNFPIATFDRTDVAGLVNTDYTATINWGDGAVVTNGTVVPFGSGFEVEGTYMYASATAPGVPDIITVVVGNKTGVAPSTAVAQGSANVAPALVTPVGSSISATVGVPFTGTVASFTVANPAASATGYAALIDWGDGTAPSSGTIGADGKGGFLVQGSHTYASGSATGFVTTITIEDLVGPDDVVGQSTIANGTAAVPVVPPVITPLPRLIVGPAESPLPASGVVGSFVYAYPGTSGSAFTAFINFGDGHVSAGTVVEVGTSAVYNVRGTNTYATAGDFSVGIAVADSMADSALISSSATVTGPLVNATGTIFPVTPGVTFTGTVATFTDANPQAKLVAPTALISWGDGSKSPGVVTGPDANGLFTVTGSKNYGSTGLASTYPVAVVITGPGGETGLASSTAYLSASASLTVQGTTFAVNPASPFTGTVATFKDANPAAKTATPNAAIDWGNGTVSAGVVTGPDSNGIYTVTGSIFYLTTSPTGSYPVKVTVTDSSGQSVSATSTALMSTPAPAPTFAGGLDLGGENGPYASAGYSDTNRPTFAGTTSPFALVQLYARLVDVDATLSLGQTIAGANGTWSLGTGPLSQGIFAITAIVTPAGGSPTGPLPLGPAGLTVIDTTPPQVVGVYSDNKGHVFVEFQDDLSGMALPTLTATANYTFAGPGNATSRPVAASLLPSSGLPTDVQTVELTVGGKAKAKPRTLRITAAGILDNAGNPLAGNYRGNIAPPRSLASSNPVLKITTHKPKPVKHRT